VLRRLEDVGRGVGLRLLETLYHRERGGKRDTRLLDVLKFVHTTLWKYLFGRQARDLEQSNAVRCAGRPGRPAGQAGSIGSLPAHARARTQASLSVLQPERARRVEVTRCARLAHLHGPRAACRWMTST
jgi:hypothetical protein